MCCRHRGERAAGAVVLGGDGGAVGRRARALPALRVGPHAAAARAAGPQTEGLRTTSTCYITS